MPSVTFDKANLLKAVGKKLPDTLLAQKMAMLGTDVSEVTESSVTVEVFPNRPDLLSLHGFARALSAFIGVEKGLRVYKPVKGKTVVTISDNLKTVRPFTACAIARKLKLTDEKIKELIDLQEKLHGTYGRKRKRVAMGIYPLSEIKPPISFEARPPNDIIFTPLEEEKPLPAMQILKDHPKGKAYGHLLYGHREFPVFVDSTNTIMSLVPIVNSARTGKITPLTKEVFIEVSGFNFEVYHTALLIVCAALADMGAQLETVDLKYGKKTVRTPDFTPSTMTFSLAKTNKLLGTNLSQQQASNALKAMGYDIQGTTVKIPAWRADILHEVDIIEDIAIGHGYDNLSATVPNITTVGKETRTAAIERQLRAVFTGLGFIETRTYSLSSQTIQLEKVRQSRRVVEMENPLTADYSILRYQLIPNLLDVLARNKHNEYPQMIFEIGPVWSADEEAHLAFVMCSEKGVGFTEAKQTLEALHRALGKSFSLRPYEDKFFISGRAAVFPGGFFGEIHPQVLSNFEIPYAVVAGEIRYKEIIE